MKVIKNLEFDKIEYVKYGFFTRLGGFSKNEFDSLNFNSKEDTGEPKNNVLKNFDVLKNYFKSSNNVFKLKQVHSKDVFILGDLKYLEDIDIIHADAVVTKLRNVVIGVVTADCVPILLVDDKNKIISAVHAGWRGSVAGIIENSINKMVKIGAEIKNIKALIGPHLRVENFEVKQDFISDLIKNNIKYQDFIICKNDKIFFNITKFINYKLQSTGITEIYDVNLDTYSNPDLFFSYRRSTHENQKKFGCQFSAIMLN